MGGGGGGGSERNLKKKTFLVAKSICESSLRVFNISATCQKMLHCQRKTFCTQKFAHATAMQLFLETALPLRVKHCSCAQLETSAIFLGGGGGAGVKIRSYFFGFPNLKW